MVESGKERMRIPVFIYTIVIALMLFSALMTMFNQDWSILSSILVSVGAFLFLISDIINVWTRFVAPIRIHRLWVMSTYHLTQVCIAVGATQCFYKLEPLSLSG